MNQDEAIQIATEELKRLKTRITNDPPHTHFKERRMRLGKDRSGWVVSFRLDVPRGFEPDRVFVEAYEPDGEVNVPPILSMSSRFPARFLIRRTPPAEPGAAEK